MIFETPTYIALIIGLIGVIVSFQTLIRKKRAEQKFEILLKQRKNQMVKIQKIGDKKIEVSNSNNRVLTIEEFEQVQERIKRLLAQLDVKERKEILEYLEQESLKGRISYLNKVMHLSGTKENIVVKERVS